MVGFAVDRCIPAGGSTGIILRGAGVVYTNVVHVKTDISIGGLPPGTVSFTTDIHQYYAPRYGLIEAKNKIDITVLGTTESTDMTTTLQSSNLL